MERVSVRRQCDEGVVAAVSSIPDSNAPLVVFVLFGLLFSWLGVVLFIVGQQSQPCTYREFEDDDGESVDDGSDDEDEDDDEDDNEDDDEDRQREVSQ